MEDIPKEGDSSGDGGAERAKPLELLECEGLPREMLESGLPEHVFARMDFLWRASHCLRLASPTTSRVYSDHLLKLSAEQGLEVSGWTGLPEDISASMCSTCGSVFSPGVNCRVRVRHRSLASPGAAKKKKINPNTTAAAATKKGPRKCLNEVVTTCLLCGGVDAQGGTERRAHHRRRQRRDGGGGSEPRSSTTEAVPEAGPGRTERSRVATNLRGSFIPLGVSTSSTFSRRTTPPTTETTSKKKRRKQMGLPGVSSAKSGGGGVGGGRAGGGRAGGVNRNQSGRRDASEPATPAVREPPSLLEKIRKDAKRKRRQGLAAAAAAVGAGGAGAGGLG
eukprot:jgi/Undpi1/12841/HiC_scaffold_7.g02508.m1